VTHGRRPDLPDKSGFWVGMAAACAALGGAAIAIAVAEYHPPWPSAWFIAGAVICGLGFASATWALVLYLARKVAGDHWCPDPQAHILRVEQAASVARVLSGSPPQRPSAKAILAAADAINRKELAKWLRPVLQQMKGDLRQAAAGIEKAQNDDSYTAVRHEFDAGQVWEINRERFAGLIGRGDLYGSLRNAYNCITRIRSIVVPEDPKDPKPMKPQQEHDLAAALATIREAETFVNTELGDLD
jgi:hypothetical protein